MAPSGVVAATELGRTSQSYHSLFLSSEWEWPGWLTVHLLCFEHFGLNTGPCAYEASALLMNSSTRLLFIFSILSLLGIKAFPVWKNSRKGGQSAHLFGDMLLLSPWQMWRPYQSQSHDDWSDPGSREMQKGPCMVGGLVVTVKSWVSFSSSHVLVSMWKNLSNMLSRKEVMYYNCFPRVPLSLRANFLGCYQHFLIKIRLWNFFFFASPVDCLRTQLNLDYHHYHYSTSKGILSGYHYLQKSQGPYLWSGNIKSLFRKVGAL